MQEEQLRYKPLNRCVCCGSMDLEKCIDFGNQPLANNFKTSPGEDLKYPLEVMYCHNCSHNQLSVAVDPEELYSNYLYVSGTTQTLKDHFRGLCQELNQTYGRRVTELAANDGSLLEVMKEFPFLIGQGVDPAQNFAEIHKEKDVQVLTDFWTSETPMKMEGEADHVLVLNCLAHVRDPLDFLRGIRRIYSGTGWVIIEFPYFGITVDTLDHGQIYHEHISYFTIKSFITLIEQVGFCISDIKSFPKIHGGTFRFYLKPGNIHCEEARKLYMIEKENGFHGADRYKSFGQSVFNQIQLLAESLPEKIIAYGASAKASTLCNAFPEAFKNIEYFVDDNPLKQGRVTPSLNIPIKSPEVLRDQKDLNVLLTVHNFKTEVKQRLSNMGASGKMLNYVPSVEWEEF